MTRSDPDAATTALKAVWQTGPSDSVIREQVEATSQSIPPATGKPLGWIEENTIAGAVHLIGNAKDVAAQKPLSSFYTNELLTH
jgi:NitT/TauT family transport system substrate-binding protein